MTTGNQYLDLFIGGIFGILAYVFILKLPKVKKRAETANLRFSIKQYLLDDWLSIVGSFITVLLAIFIFDEIGGAYPSIVKWAKFFFIFVGYTGSSLLIGAFSVADKKIQSAVDYKTNIADNK